MVMAADPVAGIKNAHAGFFPLAQFRCESAAGVKAAAGRRVGQAGDFARQTGKFVPPGGIRHRQGIAQDLGIGVSR